MGEIYKDYIPANARVVIDYSKKDKVKFTYPLEWTYKKAVWCRAYPTVVTAWAFLHFIPLYYLAYLVILPAIILLSIFRPFETVSEGGRYVFNFWKVGFPIVVAFAYLFIPPAIFTYFLAKDKNRMGKWIPKIGYWTRYILSGSREITFKADDVDRLKVMIPSFSNVYLDFKTEGEFDKYLTKIEVMEIPFTHKRSRILFPYLLKKRLHNDYWFSAVFYFSQTPKNGSLFVEFI